jgi:transcriptional regulator with XRE-family HTH domain
MEVIPMSIGQRISELRKGYGFSQEYIADKLNVSRQAVSKWEQDLSAPDTYNLIALADLLQVSVEYLATGKRPSNPALNIQETASPSLPPQREGLGTARIVGIILLSAGLLSLILGLLLSRVLIALSALFLLYGIPMLTIRRHFGLILLWISSVILFLVIHMLMPVREVGVDNGAVMVQVYSPIAIILLALVTAYTIIRIVIGIKHNKKQ